MTADTERMATAPVIEPTPSGVRIVMRSPRAIPLVVFMVIWLIVWTFGGGSAIRGLVQSFGFNIIALFFAFWLFGWLVGEVAVLAAVAFLLNGREIITVEDGVLTRRAETFGRGLTWRYPLAEVSEVRQVGADDDKRSTFVSFKHAEKPVRFGTDLDEAGAAAIVAALHEAAPSLR